MHLCAAYAKGTFCISEGLFRFCRFNGCDQFRNHLMQIADDTVVGDIKNGCGSVRIYGDDDIGFFHSGNVRNGSGNAAGEVNFRCNGFSGGANLIVSGDPAFINSRTGSGDVSTEKAGQLAEFFKAFSRRRGLRQQGWKLLQYLLRQGRSLQ